MSFLKKFKKRPEERLEEDLNNYQFSDKAENLAEVFSKYNLEIIIKVVGKLISKKVIDGRFVGKKGWYLPNFDEKMKKFYDSLKEQPVDLDKLGKTYGLNAKRLYIALEDYISQNPKDSLDNIKRVNTKLYYIPRYLQIFENSMSGIDFEDPVFLDKAISESRLKDEELEVYTEILKMKLKEPNSSYTIGADSQLYRRNELEGKITEFIDETLKNSKSLFYNAVREKFGISTQETTTYITKLVENGAIQDVINYPLDELLEKKSS